MGPAYIPGVQAPGPRIWLLVAAVVLVVPASEPAAARAPSVVALLANRQLLRLDATTGRVDRDGADRGC